MPATMINERSLVSEEYRKCYPDEEDRVKLIKSKEEYVLLVSYKKVGAVLVFAREFYTYQNILHRWGVISADYDHLNEFLESQPQLGSIYVKRTYHCFNTYVHQTMRNTSTADQIYEFGRNYVGIGFVDLFQMVWGQYKNDDTEDKILTFYGYDASRVATLRSKIIYGIMKYYTEEEISTLTLLQIWFSSCWDLQTTKAFQIVVQDALSNPEKYQVQGEDNSILEKWQKETISKNQAEIEFSKEFKVNSYGDMFFYIFQMKNETDRVKFCRYLYTGSIFVDEKNIVCGNKTMFANVCGTENVGEELFFKAIDLTASRFQNEDCFEDLLFDTIVGVTKNLVNVFRSFVKMGKIVCHLQTNSVDPEDMEFAATIMNLNPYSIDWSNVPDFFEKKSFIRFARACSVDDTTHTMHFIN